MDLFQKYLYILQLEGYDINRFNKWLLNHDINEINESKGKLKWTVKAKLLYYYAQFIDFSPFYHNPRLSITEACWKLNLPEKVIKGLIIFLAKIKLSFFPKVIIIGVTGSYGKTSVKEILSHLLSAKYKVLKTPESYNTPLGIAKVIINNLKPGHQIFIVEMGAYKKGDIKTICDLVKPKLGILTAIGKQHLERFGSQENIASAKFELIEALPKNGKAFLNSDDPIIFAKSKYYKEIKVIYYGLNNLNNNEKHIFSISKIKTINQGMGFILTTRESEEKEIVIPLLGKHNVLNVLAAITAAYNTGIPLEEIVKYCQTLPVIPHRLQLIPGANGTTIIDDAFNANPDSARAALEVLKDFPSERKIIITPGLIELGDKQEEENRIFGEEMANTADYIIIVGETNRKAILAGIELGFKNYELSKEPKYFVVKNLEEATKKLPEIVIPGAVILFENDLPDQYK